MAVGRRKKPRRNAEIAARCSGKGLETTWSSVQYQSIFWRFASASERSGCTRFISPPAASCGAFQAQSAYTALHTASAVFVSGAERSRQRDTGSLTAPRQAVRRSMRLGVPALDEFSDGQPSMKDVAGQIRQSVGRRDASRTNGANSVRSSSCEDHAIRRDFSFTSAGLRWTGPAPSMTASRSAGMTGFGPRAGKSRVFLSASWFGGRSGRARFLSAGEELRDERRRVAAWRRRWTRIHSAMRAWISTSTNSSMSSMMRSRRLARSLRRASSNDCRETFEQVARYSSIGLVVFIIRVSKPSATDRAAGKGRIHSISNKSILLVMY